MDAVGQVIEFFKCCGAAICECMKDHMRLDECMTVLMEKLEELNCQEKDIKVQLDAELRFGKILRETVKKWLEDAEKIKGEIQRIEEKVNVGKCFRRSCLAKLVDKKIQEVTQLLQERVWADGLFINKPPKRGSELPASELVGEIDVRDTIWSYLMGDEVAKIGVYGLGGVGKTTIMKHINNQLLREGNFDYVIWVTVSKDYEVSRIESGIVITLDESITDLDKTRRAAKIFEMLGDKRFVLILDDVWKRFDLEDVGIPEPLHNNGCKLVLTTRSMDVCRSMGCTLVKVYPLGEEEARSLFLKKVGFDIFNDPNLGSIANFVLEKCGGLPLAIAAVGSRITEVRDIRIWRDALSELKQGNWSAMEDEVLVTLKFSYDQLGDVKVQQCFFDCSRYPEDKQIPKKELIERWISEGYVNDMGSRQANLDKGHTILSRLESNYMIEQYGDYSVKMHALIRDMALYITSKNPHELPKDSERVEDLEEVSMNNTIEQIPVDASPPPNGQRLSTEVEGLLIPVDAVPPMPPNGQRQLPLDAVPSNGQRQDWWTTPEGEAIFSEHLGTTLALLLLLLAGYWYLSSLVPVFVKPIIFLVSVFGFGTHLDLILKTVWPTLLWWGLWALFLGLLLVLLLSGVLFVLRERLFF